MDTFALDLPADHWMLIADGALHGTAGLQLDASAPCAVAIVADEPDLSFNDWVKLSKDGDASINFELPANRKLYGRSLSNAPVLVRGYREAR